MLFLPYAEVIFKMRPFLSKYTEAKTERDRNCEGGTETEERDRE